MSPQDPRPPPPAKGRIEGACGRAGGVTCALSSRPFVRKGKAAHSTELSLRSQSRYLQCFPGTLVPGSNGAVAHSLSLASRWSQHQAGPACPLHPLPQRGTQAGLQRHDPVPRGWVWVGVALGRAHYSSVCNNHTSLG